ncbi:MAG: hypothetical protein SOZ56_05700 [Oscillospiraceae bacterium]|nr:hypothetical protein [Oscillospiraceae bacterium]
MEKHRADRLITVYRDRIFGFALSKTGEHFTGGGACLGYRMRGL